MWAFFEAEKGWGLTEVPKCGPIAEKHSTEKMVNERTVSMSMLESKLILSIEHSMTRVGTCAFEDHLTNGFFSSNSIN